MEALCQVGNKSPPKPPNSYKGLYLFHILRGWISLYLISDNFWDNLSDQRTAKNFTKVSGPWIFCECTAHLLPHGCSDKACRVSYSRGKSSRVNVIISLIYWTCFIGVGKGNRDKSWAITQACGVVQVAMEKSLKRPLLAPLTWRQIDLSYQELMLVKSFP